MVDTEERKADDSKDSRTIHIEMPAGCFEGMMRMMAGSSGFGKPGSGCCDMPQNLCCPEPMDEGEQEIRIVIKRNKR